MDATVNWKVDDFDNKQTFFTDSNGLGIVKREYNEVGDHNKGFRSEVPANLFPVNTAIFLEGVDSN